MTPEGIDWQAEGATRDQPDADSRARVARDRRPRPFAQLRRALQRPGLMEALFVPAVIVALGSYLTITSPVFLTGANVKNIFLQAAILAVVSFGVTFVTLAGELDLSVGTGVALVSVLAAEGIKATGSIPAGCALGIACGVLLGLVNGMLVTRLEVPSFMATLGTFIIAHGTALAITDGGVVAGLPEGVGSIANDTFLGLQLVLWLMVGVFLALWVLQRQTAFGVRVLAVGGNREAARLSGINVLNVKLACFVIAGLTVGIGGLILMSRVESGQPNAEGLLALEAIAAVVVGGNSLLGGRGSVARTLWGVVLIAVMTNGLDVKGVNEDLKQIVIGIVFIAAASVDFVRRQLQVRAGEQEFKDAEFEGERPPGVPAHEGPGAGAKAAPGDTG